MIKRWLKYGMQLILKLKIHTVQETWEEPKQLRGIKGYAKELIQQYKNINSYESQIENL